MRFHDRAEGGVLLAALLQRYRSEDPLVLALPRGGVPVGYEVARALGAPLEVLVVRKVGAPLFPEYAIGAIAEGGVVFIDRGAAADAGVEETEIGALVDQEWVELARRIRLYRGGHPLPAVRGRTVLLVDDGVATGRTTRAAIRALRQLGPRKLVLAAPVVAAQTVTTLRDEVDDLVFVQAPETFGAVGVWYEVFGQTSDDEVMALLAAARRLAGGVTDEDEVPVMRQDEVLADPPAMTEREIRVPIGGVEICGDVGIPSQARGVVLLAHGSGSSRLSPRNRHVAQKLRDAGLATLLLDLLSAEEASEDERSGRLRFDIEFLADRLAAATRFVREDEAMRGLRIGFFGASTGAAAALMAAARLPDCVAAIVSRGGRPDLAGPAALRLVRAPTLLVVGGDDRTVLELNRLALELLTSEKKLVVVPHASHLFEEPGALDVVATLTAGWFCRHLEQRGEAMQAGVPA